MKLKKILAILLSLMMVFTNVPAIAFADTDVPSEESGETSDDQSYEDALAAAIKAAEEQAAAQQYEIDQNAYEENDDTWTSVDEVVSPEIGEPDEEEYAPEPEYEPEPEPEEVPEETAVEEPEQEATPQPEADAQTDAPATDAKENADAPKKEGTKVEEAVTFASIVTNAKGKLNGLLAAKTFPAFNGAKNISGTSMRVSVEAPEGAFPAGIKLFAGVVETPAEVLDAIAADQGEEVSQDDALSIDIHFYLSEDPDTEIEPLVPINVTFSNINLDAETVDVYHEDEKVAEVEGEGGTVELDQFSTYTFVATPDSTNPVTGKTSDEATQLTVYNQELKLKSGEAESIDLKKDRTVAEYKNTNPNSPDYTKVFDISPATWDVTVNGSSVAVDENFVITAKGLGSSEITLTHKPLPADGYWDNPDINLTATFTVNVTADVTYDGNGGELSDETTSKTVTYDSNDTAKVAANEFTKDYYEFKGWSLTPDGAATIQPGDDILTNAYYGKTLYAVWERELTTVNVKKIWDDNDNAAGMRPDGIRILVYAEGESSFIRSVPLNGTGNEWQTTIGSSGDRKLYKYDDEGNLINYTIKEYVSGASEEGVANYEFTIDGDSANGFTITNTYVPEYTTVTIKKVWEDDSEENRPNSVLIRLMNNGEVVKSEYLNATKNWETTFTDIPVKDAAGDYITYYVDEEQVEGYATPVIESSGRPLDGYTFTVTNKRIDTNPPTISITVNKTWDDNNDEEGLRKATKIHLEHKPFKGTSQVYPNSDRWVGTTDGTITTYKNLPVYSETGEKMIYFVHEDDIPEAYTVTSTANPGHYTGEPDGQSWIGVDAEAVYNAGGSTTIELTNTHEAGQTISVWYIGAEWVDENDIDGKRSDTEIKVYKVVNGRESLYETLTLNTRGLVNPDWLLNLPAYENGSAVTYRFVQDEIDGYETKIQVMGHDVTEVDGNSADISIADSGFGGFFLTFINTHEPEKTDVNVTKVWDDADNQDGIRPDSVMVKLMIGDEEVKDEENNPITVTLSEANDWTATFENLPKYEAGTELAYDVQEMLSSDSGYEVNKTGNKDEGFILTNTHKPETIDPVTVTKVWDDDDNRDGVRPEHVYARIYANGVYKKQADLNEDNEWTGTIKTSQSIPLYKYENGEEVEYTIVESWGRGSLVENDPKGNYDAAEVTGDIINGFTITNTHKPELLEIKVNKVWNDDDDNDGFRPDEVYAVVCAPDGTRLRQRALSENNGWSVVITAEDQYKYENGEEIQYQVKESWERGETVEEDPSGKYTTTITGDLNKGFTFTNTHEPEKITVTAKKVWDDDGNRDRKRPEKITLHLFANGENIQSVSTADTEYKFENLPKYVDGVELNYVVAESAVPDYTTSYVKEDPDEKGNFTWEITNKYEPEKKTITAIKAWNDGDNQDGNRPADVTFTLQSKATGDWEDVESKTVSEANNWTATWTVNKNFETGQDTDNEYQYQVIEDETVLPDGYTATYAESNDIWTVTNTYEPQTGSLKIWKSWEDDSNRDGLRPATLNVFVTANGFKVPGYEKALTGSGASWQYTFDGLPLYKDGALIEYAIEEELPEGYTATYAAPVTLAAGNSKTFRIINKHEPKTTWIDVAKIWDDNDDQDGKRQDAEFTLTAFNTKNGQPVADFENRDFKITKDADPATIQLTKDGADKPLYENYKGYPINYVLTEKPIDGYTTTIEGDAKEGFTVTNTHEPEKGTLTVIKDWDDWSNKDGFRPNYLLVTLTDQNGFDLDIDAGLSDANGWTYTFTDLPVYKDGVEIIYDVSEWSDGPMGWDTYYEADTSGAKNITLTSGYDAILTNTHEPEYQKLIIKKVWDDGNNYDKKRPAEVEYTVYSNGSPIYTEKLTAADNWEAEDEVPVYLNGQRVVYSVVETPIPDYTTSYNATAGFDVDSTTTDVTAWTQFEITNKYEPGMTTITAVKEWDDANNQDGQRPDSVEARLQWICPADGIDDPDWRNHSSDTVTLNEANSWTGTWNVHTQRKSTGNDLIFRVIEEEVPDGYEASVSELNGVFTIKNTYKPQTGSFKIWKVWDDDSNRDGLRPASIKVFVTANGVRVPGYETNLTGTGAGWQYTFDNLPLYKDGELIKYAFEEEVPEGYTVEYAEPMTLTAGGNKTFKVVNKHTPKTLRIDVTKVWDDNDDQDGLRKDAEFTLEAFNTINGAKVIGFKDREFTIEKSRTDALPLTEDGDGNPLYENYKGSPIKYVLTEKPIDGYTTTIEGSAKDGFTVTNTHEPATANIQVIKNWEDYENNDGFRPDSLQITLESEDIEAIQTMSAATGWNTVFENLPVYKNGKLIEYKVSEIMGDWASQYEDTDTDVQKVDKITLENGDEIVNLVNTHEPLLVKINVTKIWDDENNYDKKRPDDVTFTLFANGTAVETQTVPVSKKNNETTYDEFGENIMFLNGELLTYTIAEESVPEYTTTYFSEVVEPVNEDDPYTINFKVVNKYEPGMTTITAVKEWDDDNNRDGIRPTSVDATLQWICPDDGINDPDWRDHSTGSVTLNEENSWTGTWNVHTQRKSSGNDLIFRVVEKNVPQGYEDPAKVSELNGVFTIKNTHKPETIDIDVTKVWDDDNNRDGLQPDSVHMVLKANGVTVRETQVHKTEGWKRTFTDLLKNEAGKPITYTIEEEEVEGYTATISGDATNGFTVTNKHTPEKVQIAIVKIWDDNNNQDGLRKPIKLHINGYVEGKAVPVITKDSNPISTGRSASSATNPLKYSKDNNDNPLYKYYEGQEVTYVVTEDAVDGYTTEVTGDVVTGFTITNTHIPETIDVTVTKAWDDANNQDGKRPEYLGITLVAGGSAVGEDRLSFTNNWKTTFTDLPAYENGTKIEYKAIENNIPEYTQTGGDGDIAKVGGATTINLVNEHKPATTKVVVTKKWDDENNYDKKRPTDIEYTLYANGRSVKTEIVSGNKTTDEEWGFEFTNLPKYENGEEIAYTVVEHSIDGYTTVMDQTVNAAGETCVEFTNTYAPGMTTITAVKEWDDDNDRDGLRKPVEATLQWKLPEDGFNDWIDHPEPPVVLNEANTWTASWTVHTQRVETGHDLIFQVVEKEVPDGYVASISELDGVWTIKNTHEPETFFIVLEKNWDDDNNRDRMRPESVSFEIMGAYAGKTGEPHVSEEIVTLTKNSVDNDPNVWNMGVEVPAYSNGQEIMYLITEQVPAGYECTAPNNGYAFVVAPGPDDDNPRVSFTNKHEPELVEVRVEKIWDDADDQDGKRPESIRVFVYADGEYAGRQTILNADKEWKATIASTKATKLYKYNNGEEIYYTVKESSSGSSVKPIKDYTTEITGDLWTGFTITNTHVPEEINLTVTKTWDDKDNQDGIRPEYVEVQLKKAVGDGEPTSVGDPVRIGEPTWDITYESLPKYEAGEPVKYYVEETAVDGYETTYDGKEVASDASVNGEKADADTYEYTLNITNSHEVEKTDVGAIKHWIDENNHDKVRPETILYTLYANGRPVETQSVKGDPTTDEGWNYVFKDLDKNEQGTEIAYMIVEHSVENYTTIIDQEMVEGKLVVEITNKYEPEMTTITAVKEWHDDDNRDGKRTDSVEVKLLANGEDASKHVVEGGSSTATLNDANNWATTWDVYAKNADDGTDNVFSVEETTVPDGYQVAYSETQGVFTIKNTHEPAMIDIAVEKTWTDMYDWDGIRPAQLVLKLTANGKLVPGQEINLEPKNEFQWTGVFRDLPVYENGKAIEYSVIETVTAGYECYITPFNTQEIIDEPDAEPIIRVQNIHDLETTNITATKIWDDADDLDGYREAARKATKLALQISINGKEYQAADIIFEELEKSVEALKDFIEETDWLDDDQKAEIIAAIDEAVKESYIEISKRPNLEMGLDEEELKDDKYTWENLPVKYHGQDISYRVVEVTDGSDAAKKYTSEVVETDPGMFEITNTHELDKVSHTVSIKWDDNNNQDGLRPAYVNVYLMKDGVRTDDPVVALSPANGWTYTWENLIAGEYTTAEDTPGENPDEQQQGAGPEAPGTAGTKAGYSADEVTPLDPDVYKKESVTTDGDTTIITNKYVPKAISVKGYKYWEDDSNRDGARPQSITLNLYADGDLIKTMDITAENAIDEAGNVWAYEFKDLPRYIDGQLVHYSVSEVAVPNYTLRVEGYDLHNTYTPGKTFMTVIKLWNDDRNRDGIRPDNIIVRLYANGTEINRKSISAASGWFAVFEGLNVMDGQQNVTYTITEDAVQDYESSIAGDQKAGYVITNTHTSERTEVPVTKIWDDNDNAAKMRPTGITVNLLVEGRVVDTRILTEADGWKTTFTDLPKYSNGKEVVYTISENPVAGYSSSINGYTITNTLKCAPKKCDDGGHKGTSGGSGRRSGGPKTGDEANIALWIILLIVAAAAIVIARRFRRNTR